MHKQTNCFILVYENGVSPTTTNRVVFFEESDIAAYFNTLKEMSLIDYLSIVDTRSTDEICVYFSFPDNRISQTGQGKGSRVHTAFVKRATIFTNEFFS